jgi:glycerophosphoryl diester phosphodiesterase
MNYRKLLMLSLTALVLSACGGGSSHHDSSTPSVDPLQPLDKPIVISHRGASGYLPEHTLAAYELAIKMNADYIEPDLQTTSDGVLVAMHDTTLDQNTNVATLFQPRNGHTNYPVSDFTLAEIKTLRVTYSDAGTAQDSYPGYTPSDPSYNNFSIPTFEEVIQFAQAQSKKYGRTIGVYPEAKQSDPDMEDAILATLAAYGLDKSDSPVFIQSFYDDTIKSLHDKQQKQGSKIPQILLGVAVMEGNVAKLGLWIKDEEITPILDLSEVKKIADGIGVCIGDSAADCLLDPAMVSEEFVKQAHAAGLRVHTWTHSKSNAIEAQKEYRKYIDIGIDGMFSNYPDLAILARDQFNVPNDKFVTATEGPQVTSHRGASGYLPEHTFAAYELAIKMRVDFIEPDLQTTSDGVLVVMHDETLDQNTNVADLFQPRNNHGANPVGSRYPVSDFTLAEIKRLKVTYSDSGTAETTYPGYTPSDPSYNNFSIPTFDEFIDFAKAQSVKYGRPIGIYPEAKQADPLMEDGILNALAAKGVTASANTPVIIQSFSGDTIKSMHDKQLANGTKMTQILLGYAVMDNGVAKIAVSPTPANLPIDSYASLPAPYPSFAVVTLDTAKSIADGISLYIDGGALGFPMTKEFVDQAHAKGLLVHGWTFNKANEPAAAEEYHNFLAMGLDGYFSNYPNLGVKARDWYLQSKP